MTSVVKLEFQDNIAFLHMCNGDNRINNTFIDDFNKALDDVLKNDDAQGLVTTGEGKHFSNGLDLSWLAQQGEGYGKFWCRFNRLMLRIMTYPMPTVAAINGHAFAGGAFLALAHDYRVMYKSRGWFSFNEVFMPSQIPEFLVEVIRHKVPMGVAQTDLLAMGRRLTADDMRSRGLVSDVSDDVITAARTLLQENLLRLGPYPRGGMQDMKADLYEPLVHKLDKYNLMSPSKMSHL